MKDTGHSPDIIAAGAECGTLDRATSDLAFDLSISAEPIAQPKSDRATHL